jgi:hypothetical protein
LVNGISDDGFEPDIIYITSLFTYAWEPVHEVIGFYGTNYSRARVIVGGIYASLCSEHIKEAFGDRIVYCIHGHLDTPEDFLERIRDLIAWGVVAYPMRYQPLEPCAKDTIYL